MLWDCRIERLEQTHAVYFLWFKHRFFFSLFFTFYSDNAEVVLQDISAAFPPSCHHPSSHPLLHPEQ